MADHPSTQKLFSYLERSDDLSSKFEATRIFVNIARSLAGDTKSRSKEWLVVSSPRALAAYAAMLHRGRQYPVLINDALIALALCAAYAPADTREF